MHTLIDKQMDFITKMAQGSEIKDSEGNIIGHLMKRQYNNPVMFTIGDNRYIIPLKCHKRYICTQMSTPRVVGREF